METEQSCLIPWPGKPKARPKVTLNGTYMPKDYADWKDQVAEYVGDKMRHVDDNVLLELTFTRTGIAVVMTPTEMQRFGQADIDNLAGGVMDALQSGGVLGNDSQVVALDASFDPGGH